MLLRIALALIIALVAFVALQLRSDIERIVALGWTAANLPYAQPGAAPPADAKSCQFADRALFGCESAAVVGDVAYLACSHRQSRLRWYPPLNMLGRGKKIEQDNVYAYNFKTKSLRRLTLNGLEKGTDIVLHGVSARASHSDGSAAAVTVALVNHRKRGTCVELFSHEPGTAELHLMHSECHEDLAGASGVALADPLGSFYVTVPLPKRNVDGSGPYTAINPIIALRALFRFSTGGRVLYFRAAAGAAAGAAAATRFAPVVVRDKMSYPTDIVVSKDAKTAYVLESFSSRVSIFEVSAGSGGAFREARAPSSIWLPYAAQRLTRGAGGGDSKSEAKSSLNHIVYAVGALRGFDAVRYLMSGDYRRRVPMAIVGARRNTDEDSRFYGTSYIHDRIVVDADARMLSAASFVAAHEPSGSFLVGGALSQGLVVCRPVSKNNNNKKKNAAAPEAPAAAQVAEDGKDANAAIDGAAAAAVEL